MRTFIERFNRTYREEVLDAYIFVSVREAQPVTDEWLPTYMIPAINIPALAATPIEAGNKDDTRTSNSHAKILRFQATAAPLSAL